MRMNFIVSMACLFLSTVSFSDQYTHPKPYLWHKKRVQASCLYTLVNHRLGGYYLRLLHGYQADQQIISSINLDACQKTRVAGNESHPEYFDINNPFLKASFGTEGIKQWEQNFGEYRGGCVYHYYGTSSNKIDVFTFDCGGLGNSTESYLVLLKRSKAVAYTVGVQAKMTPGEEAIMIPNPYTRLSFVSIYSMTNDNNNLGLHHLIMNKNQVKLFIYNRLIPYRKTEPLPDEVLTFNLNQLT